MTTKTELRSVISFVEEYATEYQMTNPKGVRAILDKIQEDLEVLEILKESITYHESHKYVMKQDMIGEKFMIFQHTIKGTEKVNKVKEWLEND